MRRQNTVPLIFSVTGHRDIQTEDITPLKKALLSIFSQYKSEYKNTPMILLSALAEGADQIVAEIARGLDIPLHIIVPYEEADYLQSFDDSSAVEGYKSLKGYATDHIRLTCDPSSNTAECYQRLGEYLSDKCNILIALFDGTDNGKKGGTSEVIRYSREGNKENRFDQMDGNAIYTINTPRQGNPIINNPYEIQCEYLGSLNEQSYKDMLSEIDFLNESLTTEINEEDYILKFFMSYFDAKAQKYQKYFHLFLVIILILTWIAILSLELMHNLRTDTFIIGYGVGLFAAFFIFRFFMKNGRIQNDFIHSRGLAEALRVQGEWANSGIDRCTAKYFLARAHHKFSWMRVVVKNIYYLNRKEKARHKFTKNWIDEQIKYFSGKIPIKEKKLYRLIFIEQLLYKMGFGALLLMFGIYAAETLHIINHHTLPFSWHILVLLSGTLLMTAAFIGEKYAKIRGYEEDVYNFSAMLSIFKKAKDNLKYTLDDSDGYRQIIFDLGKKALEENSKWVILHESRRAKPKMD